jgi:Permuted papain-like amidase enzyme, YaeF/YiiX, C92 family
MTEPRCLPYEDVRPQIRSGDLLLCQGESTFSRLIQHSTGSSWSHVGCLVWAQALGRLMVFESVESIGCRAIPLSRYVGTYNGRIFVGRHSGFLPDAAPAYTAFAQRAIDLLGSPYDTETILRIAARVVAAKVGWHPEPLGTDTAFICSEFCWEIYHAFGLTVPYGRAGYIAPCDFAECSEVQILWEIQIQHAS